MEAVAKPLKPKVASQSKHSQPAEPAVTESKAWTPCPKQSDVTVCSDMGRISPFAVGYACSQIGHKQPEGRAENIPLSRVWQQVKVNSDAEACYLGHEFPMMVFRAQSADGTEQLFTTEPWKLYCLQRAAVARKHLKPIIQPRFILDSAVIEEILKDANIPENFNQICIIGPDGEEERFSWEAKVSKSPKTGCA